MASIHSSISSHDIARTRSILARIAIAVTIGIIVILVLFIWNMKGAKFEPIVFDHVMPYHKSISNYFVPNVSNEINNYTVLIKTASIGSYNSASAQLPSKVISGEVVTFILEIENSSPSLNSLDITITGEKGQYLLFLPYFHNVKNQGKVEFQYVFPAGGTYNVDIGFGAPEGVNFNIPVAPGEANV